MSSKTTDDDTVLKQTIRFMSTSNGCFDARHYHSFQSVSFHLPFRSCEGCGKRLQMFGNNPTSQVVRCKACGAFGHRSCGFSKTMKWKEVCPVNYQSIQSTDNEMEMDEKSEVEEDEVVFSRLEPFGGLKLKNSKGVGEGVINKNSENDDADHSDSLPLDDEETNNRSSIFRDPLSNDVSEPLHVRQYIKAAASEDEILHGSRYRGKTNSPSFSATKLLPSYKQQKQKSSLQNCNNTLITKSRTWVADEVGYREQSDMLQCGKEKLQLRDREETTDNVLDSSLEWTKDGPPLHWASQEMMEKLPSKVKGSNRSEEESGLSAVYFASHTFSNVSRALHEHIIVHFEPVVNRYLTKGEDPGKIKSQESPMRPQGESSISVDKTQHMQLSRTAPVESETPLGVEEEALPEENLDKESSNKRLGLVTVAGGVAGGIAGLMFAGPVGWVIGGTIGQTAGMLGFVLEGSVSIGVFASGVAAGRHAGQQLQDKIEENRILALGDGTKQRVLLVRPNVIVDPEWADIYAQIRKSYPTDHSFNIFPNGTKAAKRERYDREFDIVKTDEEELATEDKVLLLVSRQLNNRDSLPGHVYRALLKIVRERSDSRGPLLAIFEESNAVVKESNTREEDSQIAQSDDILQLRRARRQDAHAVIKYVTATLLEVRPGFSVSPGITELTATAVESLVFGEVYDVIIKEIEADFQIKDEALLEKIADFERQQGVPENEKNRCKYDGSQSALSALHHLPEAHSVADKLRYCTVFLERISDFFTESSDTGTASAKPMGADSLLKMVCQHLLLAKVPTINAQVAFIEEFARDEELLRGKEGYSLVTLQASLHFLNRSEDLMADIFEQEDDF
jgi:hypothetical protein